MKYEELAIHDKYAYELLHDAMGQMGMQVKKGDVVVPTQWGIQNSVLKKGDVGFIASTPRELGRTISVRKKGRKSVRRYWAGFWRKKNYKFSF